jgi:REP element-mobilizing transposase RayT
MYAKDHPSFITVTCLEWQPLLADNKIKDIIINSLRFLVLQKRVTVYAYVIMNNHFHLIWQMMGDHQRENVQRDFLKYTGQHMLYALKGNEDMLTRLTVNAKDRKRQVWERNSLSISLWTPAVFLQKLNYIHQNPIRAGLVADVCDYRYSRAGFYEKQDMVWDFLTHYAG